jgi:hypothetical protein
MILLQENAIRFLIILQFASNSIQIALKNDKIAQV